MPNLTEEQQDRVQMLSDHYGKRIKDLKQRIESNEGNPATYRNIAGKYELLGSYDIFYDDIDGAQEQYLSAAKYYSKSARATISMEVSGHSFKKIPMTLTHGLYTALLSGNINKQVEIAKTILELENELAISEESGESLSEFYPDKYYFASCLAGCVIDDIDEKDIYTLEEINKKKSRNNALYGGAVLEFTKGLLDDNSNLIEKGIHSMLEFHEIDLNHENIDDVIISIETTALLVLARQKGYDIQVSSSFVPEKLVKASSAL